MKADEMDNEGTVNGFHLTDLGFLRYANYLIENFIKYNLIKILAHKDYYLFLETNFLQF